METPPQSPDTNPIENLSSELKMRLRTYKITNVNQLKAKLPLEWDNIGSDITRELVQSVPHRLLEIIRYKGYQTNYCILLYFNNKLYCILQ